MSSPVLNTAGDSTPGRLGCVDVNTGTPTSPVWAPIQYIESYDFQKDTGVFVDATVFADGGYTGQDKLGTTWGLTLILNHMIVPGSNPPIYDPTHDFLESKAVGVLGAANRVQLRMYDFDVNDVAGTVTPRGQAYTGSANYAWPGYGATTQDAARMITIAFLGKGKLVPVTHPYPATPVVPLITSKAPSSGLADAGGDLIIVRGGSFTGTTGVTIGGTAAKFTFISDSELIVEAPAHATGAAALVVTNGVGPSTTGGTVTYV